MEDESDSDPRPELSHLDKIVIFAFGITDDLQREGRLTGGSAFTDVGRKLYKDLVAEGFSPSKEELLNVTDQLVSDGHIFHAKVVY